MRSCSAFHGIHSLRRATVVLALCCTVVFAQGTNDVPADLQFNSFFKLPVGPRGLELSDVLCSADGRLVRVRGYMVSRERATPGRFLIAARPVRLSEDADGAADDLPPATLTILLDPSQSDRIIAHQPGPVVLIGRFELGRAEDAAGRVSWFRLQLGTDAIAAQGSASVQAVAGHRP
jgi:hypothetical protein